MGAEGAKRRARPPPAQQALLSLLFPPVQHFFHHQPAICKPQRARERERVRLMCALEVRFGAIKALLKHF